MEKAKTPLPGIQRNQGAFPVSCSDSYTSLYPALETECCPKFLTVLKTASWALQGATIGKTEPKGQLYRQKLFIGCIGSYV